MRDQENYSWMEIFDEAKAAYPAYGKILVKSKVKYEEPETPRKMKGWAYVYAQYEPETDSVEIWAFTGKTEDVHDEDDGSWGIWTAKEKVVGRKNRQGDWIEPLQRVWISD